MSAPAPGVLREEPAVPAADGFPLAATLLTPADVEPRALVVVAPAMGAKRRFYEPFATYLAEGGFAVLLFDYRGTGGSLRGRLRGSRARFHDWGEQDLEGALAWMAGRWPGPPLLGVGHSAGGQVFGLADGSNRVAALLGIAAQSGHWRHWPGLWRWVIAGFWYLGLPALVALCGYLPMRRITGGENVPAGVAREWARWGRHRDYVLSYARAHGRRGFDRFDRPLKAYGFADDLLAPPAAVAQLAALYPNARSEVVILSPADLGVRRIGHFDPFRERFRESLWNEWRDWLARQVD